MTRLRAASLPLRIAITGCDGCGKSTQLREIMRWLENAGFSVLVDDKWSVLDRRASPEGRFLRQDLDTLRTCIAEMQGSARLLFLFWLLASSYQKTQSHAGAVLHDGYWAKHASAELVHGAPESLVRELVELFPIPHLTILLDAPPEVTYERKIRSRSLTAYECGCDLSLARESFLSHQARVRENLLIMAREREWSIIDASVPADEVTAAVQAQLELLLAHRAVKEA